MCSVYVFARKSDGGEEEIKTSLRRSFRRPRDYAVSRTSGPEVTLCVHTHTHFTDTHSVIFTHDSNVIKK